MIPKYNFITETTEAWITTDGLSHGVFKTPGYFNKNGSFTYVSERYGYERTADPDEVFLSKEEALCQLERMRQAKIRLLTEWIERLEKMTFA